MAQTTNAFPRACSKLEVDPGQTGTFVDISGSTQSMDAPQFSLSTGEAYTIDGAGAIIEGGKIQPTDISFTIVYSEAAGEAWDTIVALWETVSCSKVLDVRVSPGKGASGTYQYTFPGALLTSITLPDFDASAGGPVMAGFTIRVASYTKTQVV